jgi:hypothetical protein
MFVTVIARFASCKLRCRYHTIVCCVAQIQHMKKPARGPEARCRRAFFFEPLWLVIRNQGMGLLISAYGMNFPTGQGDL